MIGGNLDYICKSMHSMKRGEWVWGYEPPISLWSDVNRAVLAQRLYIRALVNRHNWHLRIKL